MRSFCGMGSRGTSPREGTHRGSVQRRSAASPQMLFLLERSLTYHGVWRLRLVEGWLLFFSFPRAARGYLLSPLSFSRFHTLCVHSCSVSSQLAACRWDAVVFESVCLLSRARHWRRNPAGTNHVVRPCFQGLQADVCKFSLASRSVTPPCRRGLLVHDANLPSALSRRTSATSEPSFVAASADQVPRGQRGPLDEFRTLLTDRS